MRHRKRSYINAKFRKRNDSADDAYIRNEQLLAEQEAANVYGQSLHVEQYPVVNSAQTCVRCNHQTLYQMFEKPLKICGRCSQLHRVF